MGFLDPPKPKQPDKLTISRIDYHGVTAWQYECLDKCDCEKSKNSECDGVLFLVQDEPPTTKEQITKCFYALSKI